MSSLKLEIYGSQILRKKSTPISKITDNIIALGQEMISTMYENNGVGLAAPQVGLNIRMFVIDTHNPQTNYTSEGEINLSPQMPLTIINPQILEFSKDKGTMTEGCLSVPNIIANVLRPTRVLLQGQTLDNKNFTYWCDGLLSRCVQHEIDHLNGIIFTDISEEESLQKVAKRLKKIKKQTLQKK